MNRTKENLTVINQKSIFYKIKSFFIRIFFNKANKETRNEVQKIKLSDSSIKSSFVEEIKVKENKKLKDLLYLQKLFKTGRIKEKDLSKQQKIDLEKLYIYQNNKLKKSINDYKNKIIDIKVKLAKNN